MTRSRKKRLPLVIEPGKRRPNSVMIAAKFATECNIAVRQIVPIFPHWKEYKKYPKMIDAYISRVVVSVQTCPFPLFICNIKIVHSITIGNVVYCHQSKFHTDADSLPMKKACAAMLKKVVRQQRYKLKKRYFDALPLHLVPKTSPVDTMTNEQWDKLVEHWKNEQKMVRSSNFSNFIMFDVMCA